MNKTVKWFITFLISCFLLSSCAPLMVGGVVAGGLTIADRRAKGVIADDRIMEAAIVSQVRSKYPHVVDLNKVNQVSLPSLKVTSYNNKILLVGIVENEAQKNDIQQIAQSQKAADKVYNFLNVHGQRNISDSTNDAFISSKVRLSLMNPKGFSPNDVKVVTYGGTTYVFGLLTPKEQQNVSRQISVVPGVQKVVTLYEDYNPNTRKTNNQ
ncbi:MAG: BON domain-containing protein [Neisseriaceae bacterium]|nr:BON domain-containing protein [Neisseriaceae bacterium PsAf]MCV2508960.1 BON domain-containing protein [Neisseriaceae bacterium]